MDLAIKKDIVKMSTYFCHYLFQENKNDNLESAYQISKSAYEKYPAHVWLNLYYIFFSIKTNRSQFANTQLIFLKNIIAAYRHDHNIIAFYNFLVGLSDKNNKQTSEETILQLGEGYECLLAYMYITDDEVKASNYINQAFSKGCRSPILYFCFYQSFLSGKRYYKKNILLSFLCWANVHNVLLEKIIENNIDLIKNVIENDIQLFIEIYEKHQLACKV